MKHTIKALVIAMVLTAGMLTLVSCMSVSAEKVHAVLVQVNK